MKIFDSLSDDLAAWALRQPLFLTGSAPLHGAHVNVSPKGLPATHFAVLSPNRVAYIDRTGSGCETIAHVYENRRLSIMFMSFGTAPRILRLFCRADVVEWDDPRFPGLLRQIEETAENGGGGGGGGGEDKGPERGFYGARAIIDCHVWRVTTSCGFGVPLIKKEFLAGGKDELVVFEDRDTMDRWAKQTAEANKTHEYQALKNSRSLDGLPGMRAARRDAGEKMFVLADCRVRAGRVWDERGSVAVGFLLAVLLFSAGRAFGLV